MDLVCLFVPLLMRTIICSSRWWVHLRIIYNKSTVTNTLMVGFYHHTTSLIALDGCTGIRESHVVCSLFVVSCMWFAVVELNSINRTPWNVKISVCTHLIKNGLSSHLECVIFTYLLQIPLLNTMQKPFPIYLHEKIFDFYINTTYCNKKIYIDIFQQ